MNKLILATLAATMLGAPFAFADSTPAAAARTNTLLTASNPGARCAALDARFDRVEATHKGSPNVTAARALRTEGETLCSSNQQVAGAKYLASALKMIEVQPRYLAELEASAPCHRALQNVQAAETCGATQL
ncbi:hypothetical protein [Dongia deserti]|uniref:hypothetical protein n=1 Tax=Dongia deserti TaxID=2268030 RepID=UPI000E655CC2|nr:hypothetical protein [Dongia deserti]